MFVLLATACRWFCRAALSLVTTPNRLKVIVDLVNDAESSLVAGVDGLSAVDEAIAKFSDYQL